MDISVIAFVAMATVTVLFFVATVVLEWNARFLAKTRKQKHRLDENQDPPAALFEMPLLQTQPAGEPGTDLLISSSRHRAG